MKKIILLIIIFPLFNFHVTAQNNISKTGSAITKKDAELVLNHHNKIRALLGIPPLTWNPEIAAYAQEWAEYLVKNNKNEIDHRFTLGKDIKPYGENLFWGKPYEFYSPLSASEGWYEEKAEYIYQPLTSKNFHGTGHYSQMIWNTTKEIGVGVARGTDGSMIVVANYFPAGNIVGNKPY